MKRKKLQTIVLAGAFAMAAALSGLSGNYAHAADDVIKWKIQSHWPTSSSSYDDSLKKVAEELEEKTDGKLVLEPHPADSLVPSKEIFSAVKRGMIQGGTLSPGYVRDYIKIANVASGLPYAFADTWEAAYFHMYYGFEEMLREASAEHGVYWHTDKVYPTELVVSKPVRSLEDFKGLKIRSSGVLQKFFSQLGASAEYIPGSEIYSALSSGVVDGAHWGAAQGAYSMKLYETCKYHILPPLNIASTDVWVFNQDAIDELPEDVRQVFFDTMDKHFWERTNEYQYLEQVTLDKAVNEEDVEVIELPEKEQEKIFEQAVKVWDDEAEKSSEAEEAVDLLKEYLETLGRM
ncbi:MAG: TRAP transporter substrate-binding protein DctP [Desulfosalsimonas sp.]